MRTSKMERTRVHLLGSDSESRQRNMENELKPGCYSRARNFSMNADGKVDGLWRVLHCLYRGWAKVPQISADRPRNCQWVRSGLAERDSEEVCWTGKEMKVCRDLHRESSVQSSQWSVRSSCSVFSKERNAGSVPESSPLRHHLLESHGISSFSLEPYRELNLKEYWLSTQK